MRITVFGATGPTGRLLVEGALAAGHDVTAFARSPEKLGVTHARLRVVQGQLHDERAVAVAVDGADAVLSVLGPTAQRVQGTPIADGFRVLVDAMRRANVRRLVAISTASAVDPRDGRDWRYRLAITLVRRFVPAAYADIVASAEVIRASDLDWTLVRVGFLTNGAATVPMAGHVGDGRVGLRVARATIVAFFLSQIEDRSWIRSSPLISDS